ncbi:hypothetical protein BJ878DRAFT_396475, partial [Calycina marina]
SGVRGMVEPMIRNYKPFKSNNGWRPSRSNFWNQAMQTSSHFSCHQSNGRYLLCDLHDGIYRDGAVLTDPIIMSQNND